MGRAQDQKWCRIVVPGSRDHGEPVSQSARFLGRPKDRNSLGMCFQELQAGENGIQKKPKFLGETYPKIQFFVQVFNWEYIRAFLLLFIYLSGGYLLSGCATHREAQSFSSHIANSPPEAGNIWPNSAPAIRACYAILIDARSGRTLFQKNADTHTPVASTQKLVAALLVAEKGNLDALIPIAREDTRVEPMKLNLRAGDYYTRRVLLNAMLVASMNDAAAALGRDVAGSTAAVGPTMTSYAHSLGARDSVFVNATGLPAAQYSTARDMARIAWRAYHTSVLREIVCQPSYLFRYANGRIRYLRATNLLLYRSPIYNGLKTGYTCASGRCLVTSAKWNGRALILVQLGSQTRYIFNDAEKIIAWASGANQEL